MSNRAFRRMIERRTRATSYRPPVLPQFKQPEPEPEPQSEPEAQPEPVVEQKEVPVIIHSENFEKETLDNLRAVWHNYKEHLKEKYPPEEGGEFELDCEYLKTIDKILSEND